MAIPRKRFGQHFLSDQAIITRIIRALNPNPHDHLVEIGPGQGALTIPLLRQKFQLDVIEIDRDCIAELHLRSRNSPRLHIHEQDVLTVDFSTLQRGQTPLRVFGNLPYNISTPLLFHLLKYAKHIQDMLFMLQKEVAERIAAKPHSGEYGRLSVMIQYHCAVALLFNVPPKAFYPPPKVQSSIIHLLPYHTYPHEARDYDLFAILVREAFNQRRKTLRNSLKQFVSDEVWAQLNISAQARAEELAVADFVAIANALTSIQGNK